MTVEEFLDLLWHLCCPCWSPRGSRAAVKGWGRASLTTDASGNRVDKLRYRPWRGYDCTRRSVRRGRRNNN